MKRKLIFTALSFVLILSGFVYFKPASNNFLYPPAPQNNKFLFGSMDTWSNERYTGNYNNYDSLGFNIWHAYLRDDTLQIPGRKTPRTYLDPGGNDCLLNPVSDYAANLKNRIDNMNQQHNGTMVLWQRPKIDWLCSGQSSTYQCEFTGLDTNLWFYSFNSNYTNRYYAGEDINDETSFGNGVRVKRCLVSADDAGWVVDRLRANTEQCNRGEHWSQDSDCDWLIKPRIRIDSTVADNPLNFNTPVCSLKVLDKNGNLKRTYVLNVINFMDENLNYDGRYIEEFYHLAINDSLKFHGDLGDRWVYDARGVSTADEEQLLGNNADIQVYWYGQCDMWIDYVKVENDIADKLLKGQNDDWIHDEVELIYNQSTTHAIFKYYMELFEFNNIPCMKHVNDKLKEYSGNAVDLMADYTGYATLHLHYGYGGNVQNQHLFSFTPRYVRDNIINRIGLTKFYFESYPLTSKYKHNVNDPAQTFSRIPNTLPRTGGDSILAWKVAPAEYDSWLQGNLDTGYILPNESGKSPFPAATPEVCPGPDLGQDAGNFYYYMQLATALSREYGIPFVHMPQGHQWYWPTEVRREPTNEELDLLANLAVSYGAKGLIYFYYPNEQFTSEPCLRYGVGMEDSNHTLRKYNVYHEPKYKWHTVRDIGLRMRAWESYIMNFDDASTRSCIYRLADERNSFLSNSYIYGLYTFKPGNGEIPCVQDFPQEVTPPVNYIGECVKDRYLQVATFKKPNVQDKYFMIVNRRCSPYINDNTTEDNNGGRRLIKMQFNPYSTELASYNNWKIIEIGGTDTIIFNKLGMPPVVLGFFLPGEGKLYKMVPVLPSGGILAGDENLSGVSFTCEAPVYNNGHNITIGANTTIHFNDSSRFVMDGGVFTVGDQNTTGSQNITSDAVTGNTWKGHSFTNCEVNIYGATFSGLANDTTYAVNIIDCPVVDIRGCTFNTNNSYKGGINAVYFTNLGAYITNIYIGGNTFNSSGSTLPTVNLSSYAGVTTPLIIENNTFTEGNTAIFLSGVTGGAIKGNTITDNYIGINTLTSQVDLSQNIINSDIHLSTGIFASGGSELKMNSAGIKELGGQNNISNTSTVTKNVNLDGSIFLLDGGQNMFNVTDDHASYHLYGYLPQLVSGPFDETNNCFKLDNSLVDPPNNLITSGYQGTQITFNFTPYLTGCEYNQCQDYVVVDLGGGVYDTICTGSIGGSGGENNRLPLSKGEYPKGEGVGKQTTPAYTTQSAKEKYDSVCVLMRYRNYSQAKTKCLDLINSYPDSIQSLNAVSKLFLATVASDTTYNAVNNLKIYYEELILNHQSNISLVKRANYFILKCKVRMREYSQALLGFQQIINLNPYSYEGLIARWDYMATSLLIQGQGGGESRISDWRLGNADLEDEELDGNLQSENRNPKSSGDDKNPFTKEQRKDIRKSINTAIEISKNDDETKMKTLEVKSDLGDVNASRELTQMKSLKQVVKTENPKSITEHIKIVSEDIRKVFGANTSGKGNEPKNLPTVFRLSQNYPNPFNPVTKINFDLPRDSKVNIVIYDILGREVKRLVNNEIKQAGSYIVDFNASNYASGVYFYRIEAEEPNGNKFVDSKKMVLLK